VARSRQVKTGWSIAAALGLLLAGCNGPAAPTAGTTTSGTAANSQSDGSSTPAVKLSGLTGSIEIDGSSTVYLVTEAVAESFMDATTRSVNVTVGIKGTGGGFDRFCKGEIDIADASRPIVEKEMNLARKNGIEYIELPICFDALTVAVHPSNKLDSITVSELKKMWEPDAKDKVMLWNQVNPAWPAEKLKLYGAGTDSGTFDYFTEAIVGKAKASRSDYFPSEDDNTIVQGVADTKNALGYLPFGYYEANKDKLKALAIDWEKGAGPVLPSVENVLAAKYNPLTRPLFIYINKKSSERPEVKAFVEFYLKVAGEKAVETHYVRLPEQAYAMALERFKEMKTGTGFGGKAAIGLRIEDILQREPQQ
jgi:phosphate transport system substrate-binding protein